MRQGSNCSLCPVRVFKIFSVSVPLGVEYEDVLTRLVGSGRFREIYIEAVLDFICEQAHRQYPKVDHVAKCAVTAGRSAIVTYNLRDLKPLEQFGLRVITPTVFPAEIGEI